MTLHVLFFVSRSWDKSDYHFTYRWTLYTVSFLSRRESGLNCGLDHRGICVRL
jgi:hypothetical protein